MIGNKYLTGCRSISETYSSSRKLQEIILNQFVIIPTIGEGNYFQ